MKYTVTHNGTDYEVEVKRTAQGIEVAHGTDQYVITEHDSAAMVAPVVPTPAMSTPTSAVNRAPVSTPAHAPSAASAPPSATATGAGAGQVMAPMTGVIKTVHVAVGDTITNGQVVVTMEAMKMDITIEAKTDGAVATISISEADAVQQGQQLLTIQ